MSYYDQATVFSVSADSDGASNGIINATTNKSAVLIHKVVVYNATNGSNLVSVALNDHANIGSSATLIFLTTYPSGAATTFKQYASETFEPPVLFKAGVSLNLTGTNASVLVYYSRR